MQVTMTLEEFGNDKQRATIKSKEYQRADEMAYLEEQGRTFLNFLKGANFNLDNLVVGATSSVGSLPIYFYKAPGTDGDTFDKMRKATMVAVSALRGIVNCIPVQTAQTSLEVFCAPSYQFSLGYRYIHGATGAEKAGVLLGKTSVNKASTYENYTVADLRDNDETDNHILITVLHELGHVIHQFQNLQHYMTLGRVQVLGGSAPNLDEVKNRAIGNPKLKELAAGTTPKDLYNFIQTNKRLGKSVSNFAGSQALNEFVAETFAALAIGLQISNDVLAAYVELGGPSIDQACFLTPSAPATSSSTRTGPLSVHTAAATTAATDADTVLKYPSVEDKS